MSSESHHGEVVSTSPSSIEKIPELLSEENFEISYRKEIDDIENLIARNKDLDPKVKIELLTDTRNILKQHRNDLNWRLARLSAEYNGNRDEKVDRLRRIALEKLSQIKESLDPGSPDSLVSTADGFDVGSTVDIGEYEEKIRPNLQNLVGKRQESTQERPVSKPIQHMMDRKYDTREGVLTAAVNSKRIEQILPRYVDKASIIL